MRKQVGVGLRLLFDRLLLIVLVMILTLLPAQAWCVNVAGERLVVCQSILRPQLVEDDDLTKQRALQELVEDFSQNKESVYTYEPRVMQSEWGTLFVPYSALGQPGRESLRHLVGALRFLGRDEQAPLRRRHVLVFDGLAATLDFFTSFQQLVVGPIDIGLSESNVRRINAIHMRLPTGARRSLNWLIAGGVFLFLNSLGALYFLPHNITSMHPSDVLRLATSPEAQARFLKGLGEYARAHAPTGRGLFTVKGYGQMGTITGAAIAIFGYTALQYWKKLFRRGENQTIYHRQLVIDINQALNLLKKTVQEPSSQLQLFALKIPIRIEEVRPNQKSRRWPLIVRTEANLNLLVEKRPDGEVRVFSIWRPIRYY